MHYRKRIFNSVAGDYVRLTGEPSPRYRNMSHDGPGVKRVSTGRISWSGSCAPVLALERPSHLFVRQSGRASSPEQGSPSLGHGRPGRIAPSSAHWPDCCPPRTVGTCSSRPTRATRRPCERLCLATRGTDVRDRPWLPVERMPQGTNRIHNGPTSGGTSRHRHSPGSSRHHTHRRSSGPSLTGGLCCPLGSTGTTAASDAHPASHPLPEVIGYRTPRFRQHQAPQVAGPGRASPVPAATI